MKPQEEAQQYLLRGRELLGQKDFEGALTENQEVLSLPSINHRKMKPSFNIGLIYAHPENPKGNAYEISLFL